MKHWATLLMLAILGGSFFSIVSLIDADLNSTFHYVGPFGGEIRDLVPDRKQKNIWYALNNNDLYRSTDTGRSWKLSLETVAQVLIHPVSSEVLAASGQQLWLSADRGRSFRNVGSYSSSEKLFWHNRQKSILAKALIEPFFDQPLQLSMDFGTTWKTVKNLPFPPGSSAPDQDGCNVSWREGEDVYFASADLREIYLSLSIYSDCSYFEPLRGASILVFRQQWWFILAYVKTGA